MSSQSLRSQPGAVSVALKFAPAQVLIDRGNEIRELIAYRAHEHFERRGRIHGFDFEDWLWAESEVLYPCRHDLKESAEAMVLRAELPGIFTAGQLEVSVEPRRLMISGKRQVDAICADDKGEHAQKMAERIFRVHDLIVAIDPSSTTATLEDEILEIVMPKSAQKPTKKVEVTT